MTLTDAELEKIIEKCQKLLALTTSSFPAEAALAGEKLNEILAKYNLDMGCVTEKEIAQSIIREDVEQLSVKGNKWEAYLANGICKAFDVKSIYCPTHSGSDKKSSIALIGTKADVLMAKHFFVFLRRLVKGMGEISCDRKIDQVTYMIELSAQLGKRLQEMYQKRQETMPSDSLALVPVKDREVKRKVREEFGSLGKVKPPKMGSYAATLQARKDASGVPLHNPIAGGNVKHGQIR